MRKSSGGITHNQATYTLRKTTERYRHLHRHIDPWQLDGAGVLDHRDLLLDARVHASQFLEQELALPDDLRDRRIDLALHADLARLHWELAKYRLQIMSAN